MSNPIIVSGPVIVENNKVLLDKQGADDFWKFCGGKARDGETLMETAIRRSKEELGIDIEIINTEPFILQIKKDADTDVTLVHFLAKRTGEIKPSEEVHAWDWLDINSLPENLAPNILPVLKHFDFIQ